MLETYNSILCSLDKNVFVLCGGGGEFGKAIKAIGRIKRDKKNKSTAVEEINDELQILSVFKA